MDLPKFAVVGHPNKGKSSIVASLAHNDNVAISEVSGTTTSAQSYPYYIDGAAQYELIDTPGFQRPRQLLEKLKAFATDASKRKESLNYFIQEYANNKSVGSRFKDEVELLSPILAGAGIIYVVDGSVPYTPEYEAEMTILQWTGQARMALINPIGGEAYVEEWKNALGQYFSLVKVFDPMTASLDKQLAILKAFAELDSVWKPCIQIATNNIQRQHEQTRHQAAYTITDAITSIIAYTESLPLLENTHQSTREAIVKTQYQAALRKKEARLRERLVALYSLTNLDWNEATLNIDYPDMFDQGYWYLFGLDRKKLVLLAMSAGAAAGGILDLGLGGASFMTGAISGGVVSGVASLLFSAQPAQVKVKNIPLGGKKIIAGPIKNIEFGFVMLGRAIEYQRAISQRSHADQSTLNLHGDTHHWIDTIDKKTQIKLTQLLQKSAKGLSQSNLQALQSIIERLIHHKN